MSTATTAKTVSPFAVFRNRGFTLLWSGELISTIGSSLTSLAASILIYRITNSALSVGLMLMATALPSLALGLVAGVFVDRYDRKRIMIASDLTRAVLVALIPVLVPHGIGWLYVIVMLESVLAQFFEPARASVLPELASDEDLAAANSMLAISSFGSTAVGFAATGLIASQFPIEWAFYADSATFAFSAACIALMRIAPLNVTEHTSVRTVFRNMRSGFEFLWGNSILRSFLMLSPLMFVSTGLWNTILLPFARKALGATEFEFGLQEGLTSVGFVVGSLLMARVASRLREGQWLTLSFLSMGLIKLVYAQMSSIPLAIALVTISGFANAPSVIARGLLIQRNTPREARGRVNSIFSVTRSISFLVGMALAGLADTIDVRLITVLSGVLTLIPAILALTLPGLGQPAAEWRRALQLLRAAPMAVKAGAARAAMPADFDALATRLPALLDLNARERRDLIADATVVEAPSGTQILSRGAAGDTVYFILSGSAVAGTAEDGKYRSLENMHAGDFFGEIAVLMGSPRLADVVADETLTTLQVSGPRFLALIRNPGLSHVVHSKFLARMARLSLRELPRFAGVDQQTLKELRTEPANT